MIILIVVSEIKRDGVYFGSSCLNTPLSIFLCARSKPHEGILGFQQSLRIWMLAWDFVLFYIELDAAHNTCNCVIDQGYNQAGQGSAQGVDQTAPDNRQECGEAED